MKIQLKCSTWINFSIHECINIHTSNGRGRMFIATNKTNNTCADMCTSCKLYSSYRYFIGDPQGRIQDFWTGGYMCKGVGVLFADFI